MPQDTDDMMIARSMRWMQQHDGQSASPAAASPAAFAFLSPPQSPLLPQEQPPLHWGFEGIEASLSQPLH